MTNTATARKLYKVLGTTDDVTECEHCGRTDLKGTIRLGVLDADGNVEDVTYFGAVCGARAAGWTTKDIRKAAKTADDAYADAWRAAHHENSERTEAAFMARFIPWVLETYGVAIRQVADLSDHRRALGRAPYEIRLEFEAILAAA